jgi:hypothetical protein
MDTGVCAAPAGVPVSFTWVWEGPAEALVAMVAVGLLGSLLSSLPLMLPLASPGPT